MQGSKFHSSDRLTLIKMTVSQVEYLQDLSDGRLHISDFDISCIGFIHLRQVNCTLGQVIFTIHLPNRQLHSIRNFKPCDCNYWSVRCCGIHLIVNSQKILKLFQRLSARLQWLQCVSKNFHWPDFQNFAFLQCRLIWKNNLTKMRLSDWQFTCPVNPARTVSCISTWRYPL